ncbi:MAG: beta-lactamase family protein, partial [Saprospiraceae bacterium]|nr:beta-lactamase family protein [Saprospiraceae bacterium]
ILLPLGMTNTYWEYSEIPKNQLALGYRWEDDQWKLEPMLHDGSFGAMGGLITSIEDFSKYVSFHLSAWPPRNAADNGPVKRSSLREMQTPQFSRLYAKSTDWNDDTCAVISGYGFGLGISTNCRGYKRVSHGGALPGFGSNYVFYPEYGIGLMAFCNLTYTSPWPLDEIQKLLFETVDPQKRILPPSRILEKRQKEIVELIQHWDPNLEKNILAENFYLDKSREKRLSEIKEMMANAGAMEEVQKIEAVNQLRGTFDIKATHGIIHIFFTLTPEKDPKVQYLNIELEERGN